jgi:hypothetical protein
MGVWIEQIAPANGSLQAAGNGPTPQFGPGMRGPQPAPDQNAQAGQGGPDTNSITVFCRAVSLRAVVDASANNKDIAYVVRDEIANSPMVNPDAKATQLVGEISADDAIGTFTFSVNVAPQNPLKF